MIIAILQDEILRCIFLFFFLFSLYVFIFSLSFLLVKNVTKASHNEYYRYICLILKKKKNRKHLFENIITIGLKHFGLSTQLDIIGRFLSWLGSLIFTFGNVSRDTSLIIGQSGLTFFHYI